MIDKKNQRLAYVKGISYNRFQKAIQCINEDEFSNDYYLDNWMNRLRETRGYFARKPATIIFGDYCEDSENPNIRISRAAAMVFGFVDSSDEIKKDLDESLRLERMMKIEDKTLQKYQGILENLKGNEKIDIPCHGWSWHGESATRIYTRDELAELILEKEKELSELRERNYAIRCRSSLDALDEEELMVGPFSVVEGFGFSTLPASFDDKEGKIKYSFFPKLYSMSLVFPRKGDFKSEVFFGDDALRKISEEHGAFYLDATKKLAREYGGGIIKMSESKRLKAIDMVNGITYVGLSDEEFPLTLEYYVIIPTEKMFIVAPSKGDNHLDRIRRYYEEAKCEGSVTLYGPEQKNNIIATHDLGEFKQNG